MGKYMTRITEMRSPKAPEVPPPGTRFLLALETDMAGVDAKGVVERFQKFFDFYHPAYKVKISPHVSVSTAIELPTEAATNPDFSVLD